MSTSLEQLEKQIERAKQEVLGLGPMRPGSISRQYRDPKKKKRPYYQISYTHRMRGHSEYLRQEQLAVIRRETATFKRFRMLIDWWVDLALKASQLRMRHAKIPD
ncbi:MAG: hypothetical protein L6455_02120 [Kiritimatiellae bacterium]|nr:hypothetical protein [Kiritimatiellia bacterium]